MKTAIVSKPRQLVTLISAAAIVAISLAVLTGWFFNIAVLKTVLPTFPVMKPNTALAFTIIGLGLFCSTNLGRRKVFEGAALICGVLVFLIGAVTLGEYVAASNPGIDTMLVSAANYPADDQFPGRMSPHSALNFALLGLSLAMLSGRWFFQKASEFFAGIVSITGLAAILGHLYGAQQLYGVSNYSSMALHTTGLFLVCSLGLLLANIGSLAVKLLTSRSLGGATARKLLPAVILIPTILGWLRLLGQERGLYDMGFGLALMIFACVILMCGIVLFICATINKADTRRILVEQELAEKEQRYHDLFDYGQSLICIHDLEGVLTTVNPAALSSIGYDREEVIGKNLRDFMPEELRPQFPVFLRQIANDGIAYGSFALVRKNRKHVIWQYHSVLVSEPDKDPYVLGNAQDITKLIEAKEQLKHLSLTDELTGLSNRRGFQTLAEQQIKLERHEGTARGLTLMFADLDGLKQINDKYGHQAGSDAIKAFADVLRSALRDADIVARWGGDEFVVLTIGSPDETSEMIVDRIQERVKQYNAENREPYVLACSIGVTPVPIDDGKSFESLIAEADAAMYEEKRLRKSSAVLETINA